uniref:tRNA pseudouridine synthase Pus10 n=1 Tax=Sinocyclocheilus anshuiensis TaxID=1608454 RepID=A0A671L4J3_9TELE
MLSLKEKDRPIVRKLLCAGCCARCVLRFCCVGTSSAYRRSYQDLRKELLAFISEESSPQSLSEEKTDAPPNKRMRIDEDPVTPAQTDSDICPVCLGVLQDFCDPTFTKQVYAVKKQQYEFDSLVLTVSLPTQMSVREVSPAASLLNDIQYFMCLGKEDVIQVKDAFKWAVQGKIGQELGAAVVANVSCPCEVSVGFIHPETEDCHFLANTCPDCFKPTKNKASIFTRMAVVKALEKISEEKHYVCPPKTANTRCTALDTTCLHTSIFIAGRYSKFSRELPQTPWVIDGERRMHGSVEELIAAPLLSSFRADGFNFSSSGREDVDVRTLGNGQPFAVELLNPHRAKFNRNEIKQLQEKINQSSDKIRVRDLQIITREATSRMKEGEEKKTKTYSAFIWTQKAIDSTDLEFLANIKDLRIAQKTPLRVLHRRPLAVRQRLIHSMSTIYLDKHHFTLKLCTQAGTYIKEFVHGDFGRTIPNLCDLMKTDADILELDVESVDVDWPPALPD